jgi:Fur family zinc uptake transcriptional regulator
MLTDVIASLSEPCMSTSSAAVAPEALLAHAARLCAARGQRFTPLRQRVLRFIAEADQPLGAYDIIARLGGEGEKVAPPTVYRALDFLCAQGFVHRVHSENAFVVCHAAGKPHSAALLICRMCGRVREVPCTLLESHVVEHAGEFGFAVESLAVEVRGLCAACCVDRR